MSDYDSLLASVSQLPLDVRVQFIEALWDTVPEESLPSLSDEWIAEIERRSADYDAGNVQPIPWEQVRAEARRRSPTQNGGPAIGRIAGKITRPLRPPASSSPRRAPAARSRAPLGT